MSCLTIQQTNNNFVNASCSSGGNGSLSKETLEKLKLHNLKENIEENYYSDLSEDVEDDMEGEDTAEFRKQLIKEYINFFVEMDNKEKEYNKRIHLHEEATYTPYKNILHISNLNVELLDKKNPTNSYYIDDYVNYYNGKKCNSITPLCYDINKYSGELFYIYGAPKKGFKSCVGVYVEDKHNFYFADVFSKKYRKIRNKLIF